MMRSENPAEKRYRTKFSKGEVGGGCQGGGRSVPPLSQLHARLTISDIGGKGSVSAGFEAPAASLRRRHEEKR